MRNFICTALTILFCSGALASDDLIAFIGEAISATRSEKSCSEYTLPGHEDEICMDRVFELKYEVKEPLIGQNMGSSISFTGFYHYWGLPNYAMWKNGLMILKKTKFGYILQESEWADFVNGQWATCKKWSENSDECSEYVPVSEYLKKFNNYKQRDH